MTVDGWRIHIHDIEGVLSTAVCIPSLKLPPLPGRRTRPTGSAEGWLNEVLACEEMARSVAVLQ